MGAKDAKEARSFMFHSFAIFAPFAVELIWLSAEN
jgi:hypothetical protein